MLHVIVQPHYLGLTHFGNYEQAYSIVCFLMQIKDRHNGNILLDNKGHIIHIDFGFYFLSSPGKNSGFESAPFKLTRDFVSLMDGPNSRTFQKFRELCYKTFIELRKNCYQITLLVEMLMEAGAPSNVKNAAGKKPADMALNKQIKNIIKSK